jgi:hypothetical protein
MHLAGFLGLGWVELLILVPLGVFCLSLPVIALVLFLVFGRKNAGDRSPPAPTERDERDERD